MLIYKRGFGQVVVLENISPQIEQHLVDKYLFRYDVKSAIPATLVRLGKEITHLLVL